MKDSSAGMRARYRDDLSDRRADSPRKLNRPIASFLDTGIAKRPLMALHQLARLTEYFLYQTRYGKESVRRYAGTAESLFFAVRQRERYILNHFPSRGALPERELETLRKFVLETQADAAALHDEMRTSRRVTCPFCHGRGTVDEFVAEKAISIVKALIKSGKLKRSDVIG